MTTSKRVTVAWAGVGLVTAYFYFSWLLQPERSDVAVLFGLLVLADLFNGFHAVSFWLTSLRGPRRRVFRMPDDRRVDVFIPTLDEPLDVLLPTIHGALAMRHADTTVYVLDDGARPEVRQAAAHIGVRYIARSTRQGAKAGNLNHAMAATREGGAPFICVFDSDHIPRRHFLQRTLGLFVDSRIALVQTPQVYRNAAAGPLTRGAAEQQAIFFGPICSGRDGYGASFCCGTNFIARREALDRAGGFPEDSITEDVVLSMTLVGLGYEVAYLPDPLADGLGPEDLRSYLSQQRRWAFGCLDLLLRRRRMWRPLSFLQRWQYFVGLSYWLTGWTIVVYASLPVLRLLFGWQPIGDSAEDFATHFLPYFLVCVINLGRFTNRGYTLRGLVMNWGTFGVHVGATMAVLLGRSQQFAVTSKHRVAGIPLKSLVPSLCLIGVLTTAIVVGLAGSREPAVFNNVTFALIDLVLVGSMLVFGVVQARLPALSASPEMPIPVAAENRATVPPVEVLAMLHDVDRPSLVSEGANRGRP